VIPSVVVADVPKSQFCEFKLAGDLLVQEYHNLKVWVLRRCVIAPVEQVFHLEVPMIGKLSTI
jgi:hypothetical protein